MAKAASEGLVFVEDGRFEEEVRFCAEQGIRSVRLISDADAAADLDVPTNKAILGIPLASFDERIYNDGTLGELYETLEKLLDED